MEELLDIDSPLQDAPLMSTTIDGTEDPLTMADGAEFGDDEPYQIPQSSWDKLAPIYQEGMSLPPLHMAVSVLSGRKQHEETGICKFAISDKVVYIPRNAPVIIHIDLFRQIRNIFDVQHKSSLELGLKKKAYYKYPMDVIRWPNLFEPKNLPKGQKVRTFTQSDLKELKEFYRDPIKSERERIRKATGFVPGDRYVGKSPAPWRGVA